MRPQIIADLDYALYSQHIIQAKHTSPRRRLKAVSHNVEQRVADFLPALAGYKPVPKMVWKPLTDHALKSCYSSATKALGILKDAILKSLQDQGSINLERCPYCMLRPPSTWDHYLPQVHYPEFSAYHGNLVYVCSDCNFAKHEKHSQTHLEFLHPYFYGNPDEVILFCNAEVNGGALSLQFYSAANDPNLQALAAIGQRHISNLKLEATYQLESGTLVNDFLASIKEDFSAGISKEQLERLIDKNYHMVENAQGPNAWEAGLWHALFYLANFHQYVQNQLPLLPARNRAGLGQMAPLPLLPPQPTVA